MKEDPIRLAMVCSEPSLVPPRTGFKTATELWIEQVCHILSRHQADEDLTTVEDLSDFFRHPLSDTFSLSQASNTKIETSTLRIPFKSLGFVNRADKSYWRPSIQYATYALRLARKIRRERFDIVHLHDTLQFVPWIRRLAPDTTLVFQTHWHGLSRRELYFGYGVFDDVLAGKWLEMADVIIGANSQLIDGIIDRFPQVAPRCQVLLNRNKQAHTTLTDREKCTPGIIYTGRILSEAGVEMLFKAMRQVRQVVPDARLKIVGESWHPDGGNQEKEKKIKRLCRKRKGYVDFFGWRQYSEIPSLLAENDVFVQLPQWEINNATSITAAMKVGLPVITQTMHSCPDLVKNEETGLVVSEASSSELAQAMIRLLTDDNLRRKLGQKAREQANLHLYWEGLANDLRKSYAYGVAIKHPEREEQTVVSAQHGTMQPGSGPA